MANLRERAEADLKKTLEKDFGLPVELIVPGTGAIINTSVHDGTVLQGQVLYSSIETNPESGEKIIVNLPVVVLRLSSLSRVPQAGERWGVKIPTIPNPLAAKETFIIDPDRSPEYNQSIGYIKLYLKKAKQST